MKTVDVNPGCSLNKSLTFGYERLVFNFVRFPDKCIVMAAAHGYVCSAIASAPMIRQDNVRQ